MPEVKLIMQAENSDHLRKIKEVQEAHRSLNKTVVDNQKREKGLIEDIEDALTDLQEAKKKAYSIEDIAKYNQKIAEAKRDLQEYNEAGVKVEKTQQSMVQSIGKWALGLGIATTAIKILKDAVLATTTGINAFNVATAASRQVIYNIVTGAQSWTAGLNEVIKATVTLNKLRLQEKIDLFDAKVHQIAYNKALVDAHDHTKTAEERIKSYDKALDAHNKRIEIEIESVNKRVVAISALLKAAPDNEKLIMEMQELQIKLLDLEVQRYSSQKEITSMRTSLIKSEQERMEKFFKDIHDGLQKAADEEIEIQKKKYKELKELEKEYRADVIKAIGLSDQIMEKTLSIWNEAVKREKDSGEFTNNLKKLFGIEDGLQVNEDILKQTQAQIGIIRQEDIDSTEDAEQKKLDAKQQAWDTVLASEQAIFDIFAMNSDNNLNRELQALDKKTQAELKAAGDNEKKKQAILDKSEAEKLNIEKKYRKEQQKIAVAQTLINGAQAIVKTFAEYGYTPPGWVAAGLMAALTGLQVGVIKAQKFAKGGWTGKGGQVDETGQRMAGIVHEEEFVTKRGPAAKYRELLEAINRDDKRAMLKSFNKVDIPEITSPQVNNSIMVDNKGPNSRLDRVIKEQQRLNEKMSRQGQIMYRNGKTVLIRGNKIRVTG
jgi:hypothetical protein